MPTDLIFDFFGTLVGYSTGPFGSGNCYATHRTLNAYGFLLPYEAFVQEFTRVSERLEQHAKVTRVEFHVHDFGRAFFTECFGRVPPDAVLEEIMETFIGEWNQGTVLFPSIGQLLDRLAARYRLSIITNTHYPSVISRNLDAMGVADRFVQVVTSVELGIPTPASSSMPSNGWASSPRRPSTSATVSTMTTRVPSVQECAVCSWTRTNDGAALLGTAWITSSTWKVFSCDGRRSSDFR